MPDPFLPRDTVRRLTCRVKPTAQCRMLDKMEIPYVLDGEGHPLVRGVPAPGGTKAVPNWDMLDRPQQQR